MKVRDDEQETCGCGKKGCLEQYGSATGVVRLAKRALAADLSADTPLRSLDPLTAKDVFDYAKRGDEMSLAIVEEVGKMLGEAIAHITCVIDPDVVVIGGGVSKAGQILLDAVHKYYTPAAFHASRQSDFKLAVLGNDAGMYGAVRMILNK
jgi:glucokinase